ncbi:MULTISPECIES: hypothetical protein [Bradyrhizobium]|uniref:Uncharacterized protein n=1 Tax=Bradyrhizobium frederickii TaxID=2560054 RepID=A0A4Y9KV72_9BRAD|nr:MULTISPECIES: hypothetical protein [Bradyrhizobium]RTE89065.1 hypothetical protein D6B98_31965 [Bradyrhizobium sp. LVM 105]TFV31035.1 hypothetical protein E4K66_32305 [Bradyrhizobium frederickii]
MKRCWMLGLALATLCGTATLVHARPPTVQNSPGYDARLQESRKALSGAPATVAPSHEPVVKPKHAKKKRTN